MISKRKKKKIIAFLFLLYTMVKNLNSSSLPNSLKSKLLHCLRYPEGDHFEIKDSDLYITVKKRYPDYSQDIDFFIDSSKISN